MKFSKLLFFICSLFLVIGVCGYLYFKTKSTIFADDRIAQILKMRDLKNEPIAKIKTDYVIINFWASWCPPCIEETPSLVRFAKNHAKKVTLWALSQDTEKKDIDKFINTFPALTSEYVTVIHDSSQNISRAYKVSGLPETFIYSLKKNKYFQVSGSTDWDQPDVITTLDRYFDDIL